MGPESLLQDDTCQGLSKKGTQSGENTMSGAKSGAKSRERGHRADSARPGKEARIDMA